MVNLLHIKRNFFSLLGALASAGLVGPIHAAISQNPLTLVTSVDPNILIDMSVATPMGAAAYGDQAVAGGCAGRTRDVNNDGSDDIGAADPPLGVCYSAAETYFGYFDPAKCYVYEPAGYFAPSGAATNHACSGAYSGNFMNWATMTAADMFAWTMTGGDRVVDTSTQTIIERARKADDDDLFPTKLVTSAHNVVPSTVLLTGSTPIYVTNEAGKVKFGTTLGGSEEGEFNVKILVCDPTVSLESNCRKYGSYYKPEGLIQKNASNKRFGLFSFLLNTSRTDTGGVLRKAMKYVGPTRPDYVNGGTTANSAPEFGADGILIANPDSATSPSDSGIINFINKFSKQGFPYSDYDPFGALYNESLRYYGGDDAATSAYLPEVGEVDGFPAYADWTALDPIEYRCQQNFIVGINDSAPVDTGSYDLGNLALLAYTTDQRADFGDFGGNQTISSFMIDISPTTPAQDATNPLWLAAKNGGTVDASGNPDNYVLATQASEISTGLSQALTTVNKQLSSSSTVATNSTRTSTTSKIYQARFASYDWHGELVSRDFVNAAIGATETSTTIPASGLRTIVTYDPATHDGINFAWGDLTVAQQTALNTAASGTVDGAGSDRLDYLRGDQSLEGPMFRERSNGVLGDIVNSDPWFAGSVDFGYDILPLDEGTSYFARRTSTAYLNRTPMVYVGANDGMLHGVNGTTMVEAFAFVPSVLFPKLSKLTDPNYAHEFFVDGGPRAGDAYFAIPPGTTESWRTVLAGTTGAGGRSVFALDVSDPTNFSTTDVLWEFTNADDADLGYTIGQPSIVRMANGRWAVIVGNGYESDSTGQSGLFILFLDADLTDGTWDLGTDYLKFLTGEGTVAVPNGMGTPIAVDFDLDRVTDYIYAGDLEGNLWKIDVTDTANTSNWEIAFNGSPLFATGTISKPITAKPQVGRHPQGGLMVYFGTGKYFEVGDNVVGANPPIQTFYGIWDKKNTVASNKLQQQSIEFESNSNDASTLVNGTEVRVISDNDVAWTNKLGWYLNLDSPVTAGGEGERVVTAPLLRSGRIIFTTLIPSADACAAGGTSWLMEMDAVSGARLAYSPFDLDGDGSFADETVTVTDNNETKQLPVGGRKSKIGITKTPAIVYEPGKEHKVFSGSTGQLESVSEMPDTVLGRQSWTQLR